MWSLKANRLSCALLIAPSGVGQVIGLSPAERPVVPPVPDDDIERVSARADNDAFLDHTGPQ
jgi:hypothetical protein